MGRLDRLEWRCRISWWPRIRNGHKVLEFDGWHDLNLLSFGGFDDRPRHNESCAVHLLRMPEYFQVSP